MPLTPVHSLVLPILAASAFVGGCTQDREPEFRQASNVAVAVTQPTVAVASIAAALAPAVPAMQQDLDGSAVQAAAMGSLITEANCVTLMWGGLTARAAFDGCEFAATGATLDGAIEMGLSLSPFGLRVALEEIDIDGEQLDGAFVLGLDATGLSIEADLNYSGANGSLALDAVSVRAQADGLELDVRGTIDIDGTVTALDAVDLYFPAGVCLPTRGNLDYDDGAFTGSIRFLAHTPETGLVEVTLPGMPPTELDVFEPCS